MQNTNTHQSSKNNSGTWQKGCPSPNPAGRPKGSRNKISATAQAMLEQNSENIMDAAIHMAVRGHTPILKHMVDRLLPAMKSAPVKLDLPEISSSHDRLAAANKIMQAVAEGELTPKEAMHMMALLEKVSKVNETAA